MTTTGNSWVTGHPPVATQVAWEWQMWALGNSCAALDVGAMCSQARLPFCGPHPPEGDEVGGDDFALGEDHVSAVQEGERDRDPPRPPWLILLCLGPGPGHIYHSCVPVPPAFSPYHPKWPLPDDKLCLTPATRSRGGWPSWPNGTLALPTGKDAVPEGHPFSPACPVLAPAVRSPCVSEEQPGDLPGKGVGRGSTSPA